MMMSEHAARRNVALRMRLAAVGLAVALPCSAVTVMSQPDALATAMKVVSSNYELTAAINTANTNIAMSDYSLYSESPEDMTKELDLMQSMGITDVRVSIPWNEINPASGVYDWSKLDAVVSAVEARGMGFLGIVHQTPKWASAKPNSLFSAIYLPDDLTTLSTFASEMATRYAGRIAAYEMFNETNFGLSFKPTNGAAYAAALKAVYPVIKAADPSALVIGGVVATTPEIAGMMITPAQFVKQMYDAGAKDYFDALSYHPYQWGVAFSEGANIRNTALNQLLSLRDLMVQYGDAGKAIWASEVGQPSTGGAEAAQAGLLSNFLTTWRDYSWTGPAFVHTVMDKDSSSMVSENNFGMFYDDGRPKAASYLIYEAMVNDNLIDIPMQSNPASAQLQKFINLLADIWNFPSKLINGIIDGIVNFVKWIFNPTGASTAAVAPAISAAAAPPPVDTAALHADSAATPALTSGPVETGTEHVAKTADTADTTGAAVTEASEASETVEAAPEHAAVAEVAPARESKSAAAPDPDTTATDTGSGSAAGASSSPSTDAPVKKSGRHRAPESSTSAGTERKVATNRKSTPSADKSTASSSADKGGSTGASGDSDSE